MKFVDGARVRARVCMSQAGRARVIVDGEECDAEVRAAQPVTGDWVWARMVEPELLLIEEIEERRSQISRRAAGRVAYEQVMAANVDVALIVCGLDGDFNVRRIERYLALAYEGRVAPVVVLNKADVCPDVDAALLAVRAVTRNVPVILVSARTGAGFDELALRLGLGVTAVLLGSSGAGKSSILNRLVGGERQRTGDVREGDSQGRHTTTHRELIFLPSGAGVIDSPGIREIQLLVSEEALAAVFEEIGELARQCRFGNCTHSVEPGCAVREAVGAARLESFHKLHLEAETLKGERTEKQRTRTVRKATKRPDRKREK